jgi:hypothetical protein
MSSRFRGSREAATLPVGMNDGTGEARQRAWHATISNKTG